MDDHNQNNNVTMSGMKLDEKPNDASAYRAGDSWVTSTHWKGPWPSRGEGKGKAAAEHWR